MKYGERPRDDDDFSDEDYPELVGKTPNTKRRLVDEDRMSKAKKLGTIETAFTIFKGFVCTGILYLPTDIYNGGWLFSTCTLLLACILTLYCAKLLLEVHEKMGGGSFSELGFKCYG